MTIKLNIRGDKELRQKIATLRAVFPQEVDRALKAEAQDILNDAKDNYVPISPDGGTLRDSGEVEYSQRGTGHYAGIKFGGSGSGAEAYAVAVHEHPSAASPRSWRGKIINWTKAGTGAKYLEIPLNKAQNGMLGRIADRIRSSIANS